MRVFSVLLNGSFIFLANGSLTHVKEGEVSVKLKYRRGVSNILNDLMGCQCNYLYNIVN